MAEAEDAKTFKAGSELRSSPCGYAMHRLRQSSMLALGVYVPANDKVLFSSPDVIGLEVQLFLASGARACRMRLAP